MKQLIGRFWIEDRGAQTRIGNVYTFWRALRFSFHLEFGSYTAIFESKDSLTNLLQSYGEIYWSQSSIRVDKLEVKSGERTRPEIEKWAMSTLLGSPWWKPLYQRARKLWIKENWSVKRDGERFVRFFFHKNSKDKKYVFKLRQIIIALILVFEIKETKRIKTNLKMFAFSL